MKVIGRNRFRDVRGPALDISAVRPDDGYAGARALHADHTVVGAFRVSTRQIRVPLISVGLSWRPLHPFQKASGVGAAPDHSGCQQSLDFGLGNPDDFDQNLPRVFSQ